ncbi:hypothetical protein B0H14DRAFT_2624716 [Mycena olivaceomarginata]|nr:hypothetical protein B0H14DRAFT_2624716 [Mycena olivaceomarginata]
MSFDDLMPEELWIEILQDLPKKTVQNVALSHQIAPLVRTCRLIPVLGGAWGVENEPDVVTALLAAFFERLPQFTSIQYFHAYMVRFKQTGLANLCLLPVLSRLEIILGTIVEPIDCHSLHLGRITRFQLRHARHSIPHFDSWMCLLRPTQLVEMYLGFGSRLFADIKHSDILPFPHKYDGPQEVLPILLSRLTLSHITDWIDWPWIVEMLHASPPSGSIVSLTASSGPITSAEFGFLFKIFPFLSELNLNMDMVNGIVPIHWCLPQFSSLHGPALTGS